MHTGDDCVRLQGFARFDVFGDNHCVDIIHNVGRGDGYAVCAIRVIEQGDAESVLLQ